MRRLVISLILILLFSLLYIRNIKNEVLLVSSYIQYPKVPTDPYKGLNYAPIKKHNDIYDVEGKQIDDYDDSNSSIIGCYTRDFFEKLMFQDLMDKHGLSDRFYIKEIEINQR